MGADKVLEREEAEDSDVRDGRARLVCFGACKVAIPEEVLESSDVAYELVPGGGFLGGFEVGGWGRK